MDCVAQSPRDLAHRVEEAQISGGVWLRRCDQLSERGLRFEEDVSSEEFSSKKDSSFKGGVKFR